jgi:hypothetical protein
MSGNEERNGTEVGLGRLLREAGPRPAIPPEDLELVRDSAREAWRELVATRGGARPESVRRGERAGRSRLGRYLALAAGLLLVVSAAWWLWSGRAPEPPSVVATVELVTGHVEVHDADEGARATPAADSELFVGAVVETVGGATGEPSRIALALGTGAKVRVDEGTVVWLLADGRLRLERGAVYVDTEPYGRSGMTAGGRVEIVTPRGTVTDIGTRFEVRLGGDDAASLRVRVRDGSALFDRDGEAIEVSAGEQIDLREDGTLERIVLDALDPGWAWVLEAAPALEIEGRSLRDYLQWIARETGREIRFANAGLAAAAGEIRLFGSIAGLTPEESLEVVLPGSGLDWAVEDGAMLILDAAPAQNS